MESWLDFEKPLVELEKQIRDLKELADAGHPEITEQVRKLERIADKKRRETYEKLNRWERVQLARHPLRPYSADYIGMIASRFTELHGDRLYAEDTAMIGGLAVIGGHKVVVIGQQKGRDTKENLARNFGMSHPEGYRKALRLMRVAAKFGKPVITLVDTPGAYPGIGAVPILVLIIGEGGSGGALGIGVGDVVIMMEYAVYSVISPEGCAAILWADRSKAEQAAEALKLTAPDLLKLGVVDGIIPEPTGGAHRNPIAAAESLKKCIVENLEMLEKIPVPVLVERRLDKYSKMGSYRA